MSQWWNLIRDGETDVDFDIQAKKLKILRQIRKEDLVETYKKVKRNFEYYIKLLAIKSIASNTTSRFVIVAYGQQHMRRQRISGYQAEQVEGIASSKFNI